MMSYPTRLDLQGAVIAVMASLDDVIVCAARPWHPQAPAILVDLERRGTAHWVAREKFDFFLDSRVIREIAQAAANEELAARILLVISCAEVLTVYDRHHAPRPTLERARDEQVASDRG
jgi:hypothetical protein